MDAPPSILEIKIPTCVESGELSGLLAGQEFLGLWEQDGNLTIYWQGSEASMRQSLHEALSQLNTMIADTVIQVQLVQHQDWNAQWAASVKPIRIGRCIGIRPSWVRMELPDDGIEIILDPKQAFGTGHHATTALLLEWLEELDELKDSRILDVGTGSGILSMVAVRLGAATALGIDLDPVAIACAKEYALINEFSEQLELRCCQLEDLVSQPYDIIVANIDRKTILEITPAFSRFRSLRTQLFLSGLLTEDTGDVVVQLSREGWAQQSVRVKAEWVALQFSVASSL